MIHDWLVAREWKRREDAGQVVGQDFSWPELYADAARTLKKWEPVVIMTGSMVVSAVVAGVGSWLVR